MDVKVMLDTVVSSFNSELAWWEDRSGMRANFGFRYKEDGRKEMYVIDTAEVKEPPSAEMINKVGSIMAEVQDQAIDVERQ